MPETTRNLFISTVTLLLLAGAINSQVIAGRSGSSHGNKKGVEAGQPLNNFDSNQSKIQQTPKNRNQFNHLEQEIRKLQDQRELLARNQNRVEEMTRLQVATLKQVHKKQHDIKLVGICSRTLAAQTARRYGSSSGKSA
jgi:TolA-binding protein